MSESRRLKDELKNCYLNGFFLDQNTFLKANGAKVMLISRREQDGRLMNKPMIILKNVVEMLVDRNCKIVSVECKPELGVWFDAFEHAIKRFTQDRSS